MVSELGARSAPVKLRHLPPSRALQTLQMPPTHSTFTALTWHPLGLSSAGLAALPLGDTTPPSSGAALHAGGCRCWGGGDPVSLERRSWLESYWTPKNCVVCIFM